jgi:hypothetical protein
VSESNPEEAVMEEATYAAGQVLEAANCAADMVIDELGLLDGGARDLVNLVVNATMTILKKPEIESLDEVIRCNYDDDPTEVRSWFARL